MEKLQSTDRGTEGSSFPWREEKKMYGLSKEKKNVGNNVTCLFFLRNSDNQPSGATGMPKKTPSSTTRDEVRWPQGKE